MSGYNEVKFEAYTEFDNSAFCDVYRNAYYVVNDIIEENAKRNAKHKGTGEQFCNENHINNVISFLGGRGMGKSSAMLSFAYFLKKYEADNAENEFPEKYRFTNVASTLGFHILPKIDAAMLKTEESLFDVILAKMWDEFFEKYNDNTLSKEYSYNQTKAKFSDVRKSYALYRQNSDKKESGISELTELHDLAQSLNLREDFSNLVEAFLQCMHKESDNKYMVIPIDDIDLVSEEAYHKLEQIRVFFTIPKVIVLITADINRLIIDMKGMLSNRLLCWYVKKKGDTEYIQGYIYDYLAKVLPQNMRVYMPFCNRIEPKALGFDYSGKYLEEIYGQKSEAIGKIDENKFIAIVMAKHVELLIFPDNNEFPIIENSIRNAANRWEELSNILEKRRKQDIFYQWIRKELIIYSNYIEDDSKKKIVDEMLQISDEKYNYHLLSRLNGKANRYNAGYGKILSKFIQIKEEEQYDSKYIQALIWSYTLILLEGFHNEDAETKKKFTESVMQKDIFVSSWNGLEGTIFGLKGRANIEISLEWGETINDIFEKNDKVLKDYFYILLMCDMKKVYENCVIEKMMPDDKKEGISIRPDDYGMRLEPGGGCFILKIALERNSFSFENYILNMMNYQDAWQEYINSIFTKMKIALNDNSADNLPCLREEDMMLEEIFKWKEEYDIKAVWDIIPIQYVSIMMEIAQRVKERMSIDVFGKNVGKELSIIVETMISVFEEVEQFYHLENMKIENSVRKKLFYSAKLKGLLNIIRKQNFDVKVLQRILPRGIEDTPDI